MATIGEGDLSCMPGFASACLLGSRYAWVFQGASKGVNVENPMAIGALVLVRRFVGMRRWGARTTLAMCYKGTWGRVCVRRGCLGIVA